MEDRAISLNDLLDVMHEMWGDSGELLDAIMELPSVTPTQMIDKSNFSQEQYKMDLQSAYDCGKASVTPLKQLGEEMRKTQKAITDKKVLIGFNMAVALCNKHLGGDDNESSS